MVLQGYGFQFWRCRHGAYRGDGKDGQFCIVLPEQDAVVAITANTGDLQGELNIVWDKLLPAFSDKPLKANPDELAKLKATIMTVSMQRRTDRSSASERHCSAHSVFIHFTKCGIFGMSV